MMKYFIIVGFIFCFGIAFAGQSDTEFSDSVNPAIYHVSTGGMWKVNEDYGSWRVIVRNLGWEHTRSFLYLQWLRFDDKTKRQ